MSVRDLASGQPRPCRRLAGGPAVTESTRVGVAVRRVMRPAPPAGSGQADRRPGKRPSPGGRLRRGCPAVARPSANPRGTPSDRRSVGDRIARFPQRGEEHRDRSWIASTCALVVMTAVRASSRAQEPGAVGKVLDAFRHCPPLVPFGFGGESGEQVVDLGPGVDESDDERGIRDVVVLCAPNLRDGVLNRRTGTPDQRERSSRFEVLKAVVALVTILNVPVGLNLPGGDGRRRG
jgi:hypothetical protein